MDLTASKETFASEMIDLAREVLSLAQKLDYLDQAYGIHHFAPGDTNGFVDADFSATHTQLTAAIVADTMFALGTVANAISGGVRGSLLECLPGGQP
jgi:hypothetical protein